MIDYCAFHSHFIVILKDLALLLKMLPSSDLELCSLIMVIEFSA